MARKTSSDMNEYNFVMELEGGGMEEHETCLDFLELLLELVDFEASLAFGSHQLRFVPHLFTDAFVHVEEQFHFSLVVVSFPVNRKSITSVWAVVKTSLQKSCT